MNSYRRQSFWPQLALYLGNDQSKPDSLGVNSQGGGAKREAVGYSGRGVVEAQQPLLAHADRGEEPAPGEQDEDRQHPAKHRAEQQEFEGVREAEPERGDGRELGVTAADPAEGKQRKTADQHRGAGCQMQADIAKAEARERRGDYKGGNTEQRQ